MTRVVRRRRHLCSLVRVVAAVTILAGVSLHLAAGDVHAQVPTRLAYSVNAADSVGIFSVSPTTGALNQLGAVQTAAGPRAIAVDHSGRFVYVANAEADRVSAFRIDGTGLVTLGAVTANDPLTLALEPTGRFLYAADSDLGAISKFQIRTNGVLASLGVEDAGLRAGALAVHPSGRFLYCVDGADARVLVFAIDVANGDLQPLASPLSGASNPITLAVEPRGRLLYVLHDRENLVTVFRINPGTGALTPIQSIAVKNPVAVAVERTGRFLYIASPENNAMLAYGISQAHGTLTYVTAEVLIQPQPVSVTVDPTNRVLYAVSVGGRVTRLAIDPATGVMTEGPSLPGTGSPLALAVAHPTERFLYARGEPVLGENEALQAFRISDANGALTPVDDFTLADTETELALERTGRFVYVLNHNDATIDAFTINLSTGALTAIQTLALPDQATQASGLTVEPTGRFLYVSCVCNTTNSRIRAFRINATTGLLTSLGGTGGDGNFLANASTSDLTGRFLYMTTLNSNEIEAFAINQATGLLTLLGVTPAVSNGIGSLVMDPLGRFLYATTLTGYVHAFRVSAATGALTSAGSLLLENSGARGAGIDRTGRFLFPVTRGDGGSVHTFAIDQVSGELEESGVPPVYLGDFDRGESAAVDATGRFLHVGHDVLIGSEPDGIMTFRINPATGAVALTSDLTSFAPTSLGTTGPIR
jgi:6-phosphogluconolactonase (cycloisomerase 2 family)